jgi:plasmid stabilization system protein ParE
MKIKVSVSDPAKAEYKEIHLMLKNRFGVKSALKFKMAFKTFLKTVSNHPYQYPSVANHPEIRVCTAMSPTVVFYEVSEALVTVHRIRDGRQNGPQWH